MGEIARGVFRQIIGDTIEATAKLLIYRGLLNTVGRSGGFLGSLVRVLAAGAGIASTVATGGAAGPVAAPAVGGLLAGGILPGTFRTAQAPQVVVLQPVVSIDYDGLHVRMEERSFVRGL